MYRVEIAGGGSSLVVLTATRLNSQPGQGRLLFTSSYDSDIVKVIVTYFILVVLWLVSYSLFYEVYMKKSQMLNKTGFLLLSTHLW